MHEHEAAIRLTAFIGGLALLGLAQYAWPRRKPAVPAGPRWINNLIMLALGVLLLRIALPVLAVGWAVELGQRGWGLFNHLQMPWAIECAAVVLVLDLAIYLQHRVMHWVPWLWRLHRMHHSDLDFDVSTGVRFHPGEILFSMLVKLAVIGLLGADAAAVLIFETLLNLSSLFEHTNLRLPATLDRWLRLLLVTPDMHRVHHSVHRDETDSNFGFNLSCWDRLLGSYRAQPRDGHLAMKLGLEQFRGDDEQKLAALLMQPLRRG